MTQAPASRVGQGRRPLIRRPWPRLPRWFVAGVVVSLLAFAVLVAFAIHAILTAPDQPLFERRSPPVAGALSHGVGRVTLPDAPLRDVSCGVIRGLRVQGGEESGALLADAIGGLCRRLSHTDPALADRILAAARKRVIVSFANFGRTGELSTTQAGDPPRILVSDAFLRGGGQFKGFLLPVLAHEFWHGGDPDVTAEEEFAAREAEADICDAIPSSTAFRGCIEAREIVGLGETAAVRRLREAGYR